jgi:hypothetical protein
MSKSIREGVNGQRATALALVYLTGLAGTAACHPGNAGSYMLTFGPVTVPAGTERTQCVVKRIANPERLPVGQFHNVLSAASHHMILYRVSDAVEHREPYDCQPFTDTLAPDKGAPIMITQRSEETLALPRGVAYTLDPGQMIRIEVHYVNATPAPVEVSASATFHPVSSHLLTDEADLVFMGNTDIHLAPKTRSTIGPTLLALPPALAGAHFFSFTGHTHRLGTDVKISVRRDANSSDQLVYDVPGWSYSEPATIFPDPPIQIDEGGGFRFSCEYDNESDKAVTFGESVEDEMCFFWGYYYPSKGARVCLHSGVLGRELCCPGGADDALCRALGAG